jgi:hypothetical protein
VNAGKISARCRELGQEDSIFYTRHGQGGTRLIQPADLPTVQAAVANYARLKRLVDRWIDLATERSDLTLQRRAAADRPAKRR